MGRSAFGHNLDLIRGLQINIARSQAIIAAYETRFGTELRLEPLSVDLRDNLGHFDEKAMKTTRQMNKYMYQLVEMEVNEEEDPSWMQNA